MEKWLDNEGHLKQAQKDLAVQKQYLENKAELIAETMMDSDLEATEWGTHMGDLKDLCGRVNCNIAQLVVRINDLMEVVGSEEADHVAFKAVE